MAPLEVIGTYIVGLYFFTFIRGLMQPIRYSADFWETPGPVLSHVLWPAALVVYLGVGFHLLGTACHDRLSK